MILCCTVLMVIGIFVVITVQNKRTYYSSFPKEKALFHNVKAKDEAQRSNIETFFQEWEEWSREIAKEGTDGYCIAPQDADHNGSVIFVPKQGKPVVITTWIQ